MIGVSFERLSRFDVFAVFVTARQKLCCEKNENNEWKICITHYHPNNIAYEIRYLLFKFNISDKISYVSCYMDDRFFEREQNNIYRLGYELTFV